VIQFVFKRACVIITKEIIELVEQIQTSGTLTSHQFKSLVSSLKTSCEASLQERVEIQHSTKKLSDFYPVDKYAKSFNPLKDEKALLEHLYHYGFVVAENVISDDVCNASISHILKMIASLGMNFEKHATWVKDTNNTSLLSRVFFELYHDDVLAQIRQSLPLYLYHVVLWGRPFLWTSFDRLGVKLPHGDESKGLPLHVDQNPTVHSSFQTIQGVIALDDCPVERGTFVAIPRSSQYFSQYSEFISPGYKGEYILLPDTSELYKTNSQAIPIKKGCIVSWDSRTTHCNSDNISTIPRFVAYVSTGIAKDCEEAIESRKKAFSSGLGENNRNAYMHASKKPRFTNPELMQTLRHPEKLTLLGQALYGLINYEDIS
jgi:Phytanoyl-CoA dioxygenase (PhyH)